MAGDDSKKQRDDDRTRLCIGAATGDRIVIMDGLIEVDIKVASSKNRVTLCFTAPRALPIRRQGMKKNQD